VKGCSRVSINKKFDYLFFPRLVLFEQMEEIGRNDVTWSMACY